MPWALIDVEERARAHGSFRIPPRPEREALSMGDLAKLVFVDPRQDSPGGERMWVEIVTVGDGCYQGKLRNVPVLISDLEEGALVAFGPEHVADWTAS